MGNQETPKPWYKSKMAWGSILVMVGSVGATICGVIPVLAPALPVFAALGTAGAGLAGIGGASKLERIATK